jgi:hypothetical protein
MSVCIVAGTLFSLLAAEQAKAQANSPFPNASVSNNDNNNSNNNSNNNRNNNNNSNSNLTDNLTGTREDTGVRSQTIVPFFINTSPESKSTGNTTTTITPSSLSSSLESHSSINSTGSNFTSSLASSVPQNSTNWNSVKTALGIQFMVPPDWVANQFDDTNSNGDKVRGINFTSTSKLWPSSYSFFMVNVTENNENNNRPTTLSTIADSLSKPIQKNAKQNLTISGLPAYEIVSVKEIPSLSEERKVPQGEKERGLINITDIVTHSDGKTYHIRYSVDVNDVALLSTFKNVLATIKIGDLQRLSLDNNNASKTQAQNLSSSLREDKVEEEEEEQDNDIDDVTSPSPVPLESQEQNQQQSSSSSPPPAQPFIPAPMQQPQSPYIQAPPAMQQYPYSQPMIPSSPYSLYDQLPPYGIPQNPIIPPWQGEECLRLAECVAGIITNVASADIFDISSYAFGDLEVQLSLVDAPDLDMPGGLEARNFAESYCPADIEVLVDEDDGLQQPPGKLLGLLYCGTYNIINKISLNQLLLQSGYGRVDESACGVSEFSTAPWVLQYGCN